MNRCRESNPLPVKNYYQPPPGEQRHIKIKSRNLLRLRLKGSVLSHFWDFRDWHPMRYSSKFFRGTVANQIIAIRKHFSAIGSNSGKYMSAVRCYYLMIIFWQLFFYTYPLTHKVLPPIQPLCGTICTTQVFYHFPCILLTISRSNNGFLLAVVPASVQLLPPIHHQWFDSVILWDRPFPAQDIRQIFNNLIHNFI